MKKIIIVICLFAFVLNASAQKKYRTVEAASEALRIGMVDADVALLDVVTDDSLSYGHSGGKIQNKSEFIEQLRSGKSDFVTITITNQHITQFKCTAILRHTLFAATNDNGKPGTVKLDILLVWRKVHGSWKLIARQAVHNNETK